MIIQPYARQAHFYETDQMGVIHHANYIYWFEEARTDLLEQVGYPYRQVEEEGFSFAVLGLSCNYHVMSRFSDTLFIQCHITAPHGAVFSCLYQVRDAKEILRASGETRHAVLDKTGRPVALKKALPCLYEKFLELAEANTP